MCVGGGFLGDERLTPLTSRPLEPEKKTTAWDTILQPELPGHIVGAL